MYSVSYTHLDVYKRQIPYFSKYSSAQERKSFFDTLLDFASLSSRANVFRSMAVSYTHLDVYKRQTMTYDGHLVVAAQNGLLVLNRALTTIEDSYPLPSDQIPTMWQIPFRQHSTTAHVRHG